MTARSTRGHRELEEARKGPSENLQEERGDFLGAPVAREICTSPCRGCIFQSPVRQQRSQHAVEQLSLSITTTEPAPQLEIPASP